MALFVLASKDGWVNIMYTGLDAVGVDMQVNRVADAISFITEFLSHISHLTFATNDSVLSHKHIYENYS